MVAELREVWSFRELLLTMVQRDLKVRYKNSVLGFLWSFLNPLATTVVMTVVFSKLMHNGVENYSAYLLSALLPFTFFQSSVLDSAQSILGSMNLVKKVYFPRELLPISMVIGNFIHLMLGYVVFFLLLLVVFIMNPKVVPFQWTTIYLPILLAISFTLAIGMSLLVSALNTFYEDVKYLVSVLFYLLFYLCPIMYFIENIGFSGTIRAHPILYKLYNLNPIADLSVAYRKILLAPTTIRVPDNVSGTYLVADRAHGTSYYVAPPIPLDWNWIAYSACISLVMLAIGYSVFNRLKFRFVERV